MKIKNGFVMREVGGANVVVPVGEMSKTFHGMINLNETGAFLWRFFNEDRTIDDAVAALLEEYDVDEALAREEVEKFVETIKGKGFAE